MRWSFLCCIVSLWWTGYAQNNDFEKAEKAFRNQQYDSATYYINASILYFRRIQHDDSLTFAYVQKANMIWRQEGNRPALRTVDEALEIASRLSYYSVARIAALNQKAQILVHNAEAKKAKGYFMQALERIPDDAKPNDIYADLYNNISWLYLELQNFPDALHYAEKARNMIETMYGRDSRSLIGVYQSLMLIAHDAGWFNDSEKYGTELVRLGNLHLPPDHPNMGLIHNDLGTLYESMYRLDEAVFHRQKMVEIIQRDYAKHKNPQLLAIAYNNMGNLYNAMGEFQLAEEYFEKSRSLHEINFGSSGAGYVRPLVHLANVKRELEKYEEADALYNQAYSLQKEVAADDWRNMAYVESQYGDLFFDKKDYRKAENLYAKSLLNNRKAGVIDNSLVEQTRTTLAESYARQGRTKEALELLKDVLSRYRKGYPKGNIVIAGQYDKISQTYYLDNQQELALRFSDSVFLELLQVPVLPDTNWVQELPYSHFIIRYLNHRSEIESALYKKNGSLQLLKNTIELADRYESYFEKSIPAFRMQATLIQIASQHRRMYNLAIEACWELFQHTKDRGYLEKAFAFAESSRSLLLRLSSNNIMVDASRTVLSEADEQDLYWRKKISSLNTQYLDEEKKNDSLLTLLTSSVEMYSRFQDSLYRSDDELTRRRYNLRPAGITEVQNQLKNHKQTLLEYVVTDNAVFVFVLNGKQFEVKRLSRDALKNVSVLKELYNTGPVRFSVASYQLFNTLIQPVERYITTKQLVIIPDNELFYLNFEVLISDSSTHDFSKMNYLINRYEISYQLTTSALLFDHKQNSPEDKALLFAPVFTDVMKQRYLQSVGDSSLADRQYFTLMRQPFIIRAAREIGKLIRSDLFAEQAAIESEFKQRASQYNILHLGTHAEVNNSSPLQSRFFMAKPLKEDSTDRDDGYLYAYEIYAMQLRADLAVLTACETGSGNWRQGEGVMSLAHSFMYAGCPSVVMSLWKIDEKSSADIITTFYKYLADGKTKSESLRLAKLHHLQSAGSTLAHPYFWAGMTLVGSEDPLFESPFYAKWAWVAGLLLVAVVCWYFLLRKKS